MLNTPMLIATIFDVFWANLMDTSWMEFIAVIFGLLSVWYAKKENILVYPTGIVSVLLYVYICFEYKIYADAGINFFYFVMSVYGWYMWTAKTSKPDLQITASSRRDWFFTAGIFVVSILIIMILLKWFKRDDIEYWSTWVPYIDTFTTSVFFIAMLQMAQKKIENWLFWIVGDVISVPLYTFKGLVFTSFQYLVFLLIAILGYLAWREKLMERENQART